MKPLKRILYIVLSCISTYGIVIVMIWIGICHPIVWIVNGESYDTKADRYIDKFLDFDKKLEELIK